MCLSFGINKQTKKIITYCGPTNRTSFSGWVKGGITNRSHTRLIAFIMMVMEIVGM